MELNDTIQPSGVVVITGASRGLGLAAACLLGSLGVRLVLTARHRDPLERAGRTLRAAGTRLETVVANVAEPLAMQPAFQAANSLGNLQGLINNAGWIDPVAPLVELDIAALGQHLQTNVVGVAVTMQIALRYRHPGVPLRIINVSSGAATHPYAGWSAYCASKAAVNMLTRVASEETSRADTSVVAAAPGVVATDMQKHIRSMPASRFPEVAKFIALDKAGKLLHPVDAALPLEWLVRHAPLSLSGSFLDTRDPEFQARLRTREHAAEVEQARARAHLLFEEIQALNQQQ